MTWTLVQAWAKSEGTTGITSRTVTLGVTPTTGNLLIAGLIWADIVNSTAGTVAFKDANNVSFAITPHSPENSRPTTAGIVYLAYLQVPGTPNGAITSTFNTTSTGGLVTLWVAEYAPPSAGTITLDSDNNGSGTTGTAINTPTLTVTGSDDLCVAIATSDHQVSTVDAPWTQRQAGAGVNQYAEGIGDILSRSSNVTVAMTQNTSSGWGALAASFKVASSFDPTLEVPLLLAGPPIPPSLSIVAF